MVGTAFDTPPTLNVSVHVPAVGWEVVKDTKSKLNGIGKRILIFSTFNGRINLPNLTNGF
jgi:hypothetical protein